MGLNMAPPLGNVNPLDSIIWQNELEKEDDLYVAPFALEPGKYVMRVLGSAKPQLGVVRFIIDQSIEVNQDWYREEPTVNLVIKSTVSILKGSEHVLAIQGNFEIQKIWFRKA